jgi:hypothetical protein
LPCSCCSGTDVAAFCRGGYCPAEEQARYEAEQERAYEEQIETEFAAAETIAALARGFG